MTPKKLKSIIQAAKSAGAVGVEIDGEKIFIDLNGPTNHRSEFNPDEYRAMEAAALRRGKAKARRAS